jgi:signal transduction histidine kinase/CheY-like chemotaxis protein/PAS domain-containing protein
MTAPLPKKSSIPIPENEIERLAALHRYKILDTPPEEAFDRITRLVAKIFDAPIALVSLVDESRAWFKSCIGFGANEVSREATLCSFAVLTDEPLIVADTRLDDRFACNPFVQNEPGVRFYAGAPLLSHDGFNLGTLCILDSKPRTFFNAEQQATLVDLAAIVVDELELRLAAHKIAQVDAALLEINQGVATVTGEAFINALVRHFAKVLDTDYVYIGLVEGDNPRMMRTIATYAHGQMVENMEYPLQNTPCWEAIERREICCHPRNVQARFPNAALLKPLCVESYVAIPFFDSNGSALGLLGIMDGKPLENVQLAESLLTIFASRITTELERQETEELLLRSEQMFSALVENAPFGVYLIDSNFRLKAINQGSKEVFANIDPLIDRDFAEILRIIWQEPFATEVIEQFFHTLTTGESYIAPPVTEKRYGSEETEYYDWQIHRIALPDGSYGVVCYFYDLTEIKRAEEIVRRTAERDAFLVTLADALRPLTNPIEIQITASRVLGEHLGANRVAYFEICDSDYYIERDYVNGVKTVAGSYPIALYGANVFAGFCSGRTVSMSDVSTDSNLSPTQREAHLALDVTAFISVPLIKSGEFVAGLTVHTHEPRVWTPEEIILVEEVAERTWAAVERARAEAEVVADLEDTQLLGELSAQLVTEGDMQKLYQEILSVAIALTRADGGTMQFIDKATQDLSILASQGFEGHIIEHFSRVNASSNTSCGIALRNGERAFVDFDVPDEDPDGSLQMLVSAGYLTAQSTPLISRAGKIIGMVTTHWREHRRSSDRELRFLDLLARQAADAIEQRQMEIEREKLLQGEQTAREKAEQANRIKDEFLAVLSHELRSPLNPILGWSQLLRKGNLDDAKIEQGLATIERNAKLQSELIEDLLDVSRILQGKLNLKVGEVDPNSIVRAAIETVRLAAEAKSISIETNLASNVENVLGDPTRLQQVVWNLLSNAVKFTPAGGCVTVELERVSIADEVDPSSSDRTKSVVEIIIRDNGKGITADFLPHVFDYFRQEDGTTTRRFGGLGLGLAIVRHLVELHGGTIAVESEGEGLGATFRVRLPSISERIKLGVESDRASDPSSQDLRDVRVLVIDDEVDSRDFIAFVLELAGAIVTTAATAGEGFLSLTKSSFDVLLSDIGMPDMDGYMLMRQIRSLSPKQGGEIKAIALTAYAGDFDRQQALQAGFQEHLSKPIKPDALVRAIAHLIMT